MDDPPVIIPGGSTPTPGQTLVPPVDTPTGNPMGGSSPQTPPSGGVPDGGPGTPAPTGAQPTPTRPPGVVGERVFEGDEARQEQAVEYQSFTEFPGLGQINNLCQLTQGLWYLGFIVLFVSVLATLVYGAFMYTSAGVNAGKVNQAKEVIGNAVIGLVIGLSVVIVIQVLNPGLLTSTCEIQAIEPVGNSTFDDENPNGGGDGSTFPPGTSVPGNRDCDGCVTLSSRGVTLALGYIREGTNARAMPQVVDAWKRVQDRMAADGNPIFATAAYSPGKGHSPGSQHYQGLAIDGQPIDGARRSPRVLQQMIDYCKQEGFTWVDTYAGGWVHCDMR